MAWMCPLCLLCPLCQLRLLCLLCLLSPTTSRCSFDIGSEYTGFVLRVRPCHAWCVLRVALVVLSVAARYASPCAS